jgi:ABC-type dipeptide/oligopeptide/nickel transport system permease subunit
MKNTIKQVFHSGKFLVGFVIFVFILVYIIVYPLVVATSPMEMIGNGNFFPPGTYISQQEAATTSDSYQLNVDTSASKLNAALGSEEISAMADWLEKFAGIDAADIDVSDTEALVKLWQDNYDPTLSSSLKSAKRKYYKRLNDKITEAMKGGDVIIAEKNEDGELEESSTIGSQQFVNVGQVGTKRTFILGTDNFGRDVLTELVYATKSSLKIGLVAGLIATAIGLLLGMLAGYLSGTVDNVIMFITNLFTVIPSFVILILISYSVGDKARGIMMVAFIIGITSWPWTCRSVRSQVISLRNRDHVNLSKLSGHSMVRIIFTDILPYIASYVVMAMILQISSGILAEAQLSILGLGPATTKTSTLGLMMQWAMTYSAHTNGSWWAYFPVVLVIALISFSLNLMNTGLDQVFNPQLRD